MLYPNIFYCFAFIEVLTASRISLSLRPHFILRKKDFQRWLFYGSRSSTILLLHFRSFKFCSIYFREYFRLWPISSADPGFFLGHPVYFTSPGLQRSYCLCSPSCLQKIIPHISILVGYKTSLTWNRHQMKDNQLYRASDICNILWILQFIISS